MRYEKAETVLRVALDMQASALGLSLEELQRNYSDKPLSRRTAERLRDAIERLFPQIEQANPGEVPKRWRLPGGTVNGLASVTAAELADLGTAISLLRRENMDVQAQNAERGVAKMRALVKRPVMNRIEPDLEALTEAEGLAMRPGPRPKINAEIVSALREAIITRRKVRLHYLYRGSGKRGYQIVHPYGFLYGKQVYDLAIGTGGRPEAERKRVADCRIGNMCIVEKERPYRLSPKNAFTIEDRSVVSQTWTKSTIKRLFVRPITVVVGGHFESAFFGTQSGLFN